MTGPEGFPERLDAVRVRLEGLAEVPAPARLTEPDPPTGERWAWGQVWAHLAEFPDYWIGQVRAIVAASGADPVPFGRTKADPVRVEAIERDRRLAPEELMARLGAQLDELRLLFEEMPDGAWARVGLHPTLGEMPMDRIFEEFLIGHLEAHAGQLDGLLRGG